MRLSLFILSTAIWITACNGGPKAPVSIRSIDDSLRFATDTTGLAEYQNWKAQNELGETEDGKTEKKQAAAQRTTGSSQGSRTDGMNSESGNTAKTKKGWSKTAKGAVIGGVVGGVLGGVIGNNVDVKKTKKPPQN